MRPFGPVNWSFGPTDLGNPRSVYTRIGLGKRSAPPEGVVFPGSWTTWVFRFKEIRQLTLPHTVKILATTVRKGTRELSDLSESHDLNSGCSVGDDSTAPPSGRLSPPNPGPQQYIDHPGTQQV